MTEDVLTRAQAGDEAAFSELIDPYRHELQLHCYRILGSTQDAEDALQETLLAAWRGLGNFQGRSSVRTWLYQIASHRCVDALRASAREPKKHLAMTSPPEPTRQSEPIWLEPYPDSLIEGMPDRAPGPAARYDSKEVLELSFVAGLQHLPAQQRAVLLLRDVLGYGTVEVAQMLDTTEAAVNGALRRARATFESRRPARDRERVHRPNTQQEREIVGRFATAVETGDIDSAIALLTDDAWLRMPPEPYEYQGHEAIARFLRHRASLRGAPLRVVHTRANTQPALACYLCCATDQIARPYGLIVLTMEETKISAITWFADSTIFPYFGLPRKLRRTDFGPRPVEQCNPDTR